MTSWILLRGLTHEIRHWRSFPEELQAEFPGDLVLALELPGNGELNAMPTPDSIGAMAEHCRLDLAARGVAPPYRLVAMSMGGMIATAWAQAHPGEVEALVLINTSFGTFNAPWRRLRLRAWPRLVKAVLDKDLLSRERIILGLTSTTGQDSPEVVEAWTAIARTRPVSPANALRQLLASARFRAPAQAPAPTLVLAGGRDGLVATGCSRAIARRWHCALRVHPEAGHDLTLDDGPWVARAIRAWLEP